MLSKDHFIGSPARLLFFCFILIMSFQSQAQSGGLQDPFDASVNPSFMLDATGPIRPDVEGTFFLDEEWKPAAVKFYQSKRSFEFLVRFDIERNHIHIKEKNLFIRGENIEYFKIEDQNMLFINLKEIPIENKEVLKNPVGFIQLFEGSIASSDLVIEYQIQEKKPNYNPALDIGSNTFKYILVKNRYLIRDNMLWKVPNRKKKIAQLLEIPYSSFSEIVSRNDLDLDKDRDLRSIIIESSNYK